MFINKGNKEPVRCVVMGKTGSGKSSLANVLLGKTRFKTDPCGSSVTSKSEAYEGYCKGNAVKVVDTPGFFDTNVDKDANEREIIRCLMMSKPGPHVILFCTAVSRFTKEDAETLRRVKRMLGDYVMNYMVIVFTNKDRLDNAGKTEKEYIERAPPALKEVLKEVRNKPIFINSTSDNLAPALNSLSTLINDVNTTIFYTHDKYKKGIKVLKKLVADGNAYKKAYTEWKSKRTDIIKELCSLKTYLDGVAKDVSISKVAGSVGGIAGLLMAVGGLVAAPFSFGTSLAFTAAGAGIALAGGATSVGATVADLVITEKQKTRVHSLLQGDTNRLGKLCEREQTLTQTLSQVFLNNEIKCVIKYVLKKTVTRARSDAFEKEVKKGLYEALLYLQQCLKMNQIYGHSSCLSPLSAMMYYIFKKRIFAVDIDGTIYIIDSNTASTESLPPNFNTFIQNSKDLHNIRENLKENMDDYDKVRDVLFIFVDEVSEFLNPPPKKD